MEINDSSLFVTKRALFRNVKKITGGLTLRSLHLAGAFPVLAEVASDLTISNNFFVWLDGGVFPVLVKVGGAVTVSSNSELVSLDGF